ANSIGWVCVQNGVHGCFKSILITMSVSRNLLNQSNSLANTSESDSTVIKCIRHVTTPKLENI
ncbi:hypothetical protein D047_3330B, partial [Vibrio parahaemolyticus VPTS-2010_2]